MATRGLPDRPTYSQFMGALYDKELPLPAVSLQRCLADQRRDRVTGLPLGPASAALRYLLPVYDLERNTPPGTSSLQHQLDELRELHAQLSSHVTGSSIERLSVPPYTERADGSELPDYRVADVDFMLEMRQLTVAPRRGAGRLYQDPSRASHRGYTRVVFDTGAESLPETLGLGAGLFLKSVQEEEAGQPTVYISLDGVNEYLASQLNGCLPGLTVVRHGPAVTMQSSVREERGGAHSYLDEQDVVPALPLTEHPPEVGAWLRRVQGRSWPPFELREEIQQSGRCFLVGAGHSSSQRRDLEWRMSFSDLEKRLAHSVSPQQRKVYVLVKMMQKCYLQEPKVLVTYHIKTLMFWELEECDETNWPEEELFEHVLAMLDRIQMCLERHNIPSYFIPDNNLISHASAADVSQVLETVRQIRLQPLQHLYGIDDRFRFDFSSPKPLSQLHAPLREAVLAGRGGGEVAEALVLSLVGQAGADVHRGLVSLDHCVGLLRDAWHAMAAAVPPAAPHPVHSDWALFAAAAVFTSMEADESAWLTLGVRLALEKEKRPPATKQMTEQQLQVADALIAPMVEREGGADSSTRQLLQQAMETTRASGTIQEQSPTLAVLSLIHARLELLRDIKNRNSEGLAGSPPMAAAITSTRLQLGLIDVMLQFQLKGGGSPQQACLDAFQKALALMHSLGAGGSQTDSARAAVDGVLAGLGVPADVTDAMKAVLAPNMQQLLPCVVPSAVGPARLQYETDPRVVLLIPLDMIGTYIFMLGEGVSDQALDRRYTAFFNMAGFWLKHGRHLYAFRTVGRLTCLRLAAFEAEMTRVTYDVNCAPLYEQQLPPPVRRLLRLSAGRAALGVLFLFVDFIHLTLDWALMEELGLRPQKDAATLEKTVVDAAPFASEDVRLTHQLMRLCVLRILGKDTGGCLEEVGRAGGEQVALAAAEIVAEWHPTGDPRTQTASGPVAETASPGTADGAPTPQAQQGEAVSSEPRRERTPAEVASPHELAVEAQPGERKPPSEAASVQAQSSEARPSEALSAKAQPAEKLSAAQQSAEEQSAEEQVTEKLSVEKLSAKKLSVEKLSAEKLSVEKQSAEEQSAEEPSAEKSSEEQSAEKLSGEKKQADRLPTRVDGGTVSGGAVS